MIWGSVGNILVGHEKHIFIALVDGLRGKNEEGNNQNWGG